MFTFELLPTDEIFEFMELPDRGYLNEKYQRLDYGSFYSILVLGFVFIVMIWMLLLYPIYLALYLCGKSYRWPRKFAKGLNS